MDEQVNPLERDHSLFVVLPGGQEKNATVHGSQPVMDLLVTLCASYHLNPSDYTVEFLSPNKNNINFKPNSPIGSLEAEKIVLKPKGVEEKIRRPYMPEASVRLLINYNKSHKAVVRVSPTVPLEMLLQVVCDKCEFNVETTVLLRDSQSKELLDLSKTLNEHGLREVFAKDTAARDPADQPRTPEAAVTPTEVISPPPLQDLPKREKKQKENAGFLSLFRRGKKKAKMEGTVSTPASPAHSSQVGVCMNGQDDSSPDAAPADMPKKRRAPQPPMGVSQSVPNNLSTCHQRSAESTLGRTKRRAPPPPCANPHQELQADSEVKVVMTEAAPSETAADMKYAAGSVNSLNTVEEQRESDDSDSVNLSRPSSSSPYPSQPWSSSSSSRPSLAHLHEIADPYLPSFRGKDLSDARSALAKVLTSSVSKGTLVKRLRNSATFPKLYKSSSFMPNRCSGNDFFCTEPEPVLSSKLPTEPEWEDPLQRKGTTTFKVVPTKKHKSHDPELTESVPDQIIVEDKPESEGSPEKNQTETEEEPCSPKSQTATDEHPCSPKSQTATDEHPCSPKSQTEADEHPCSPKSQTATDEHPCSPKSQTETEEDPCSPDRSETEAPSLSPAPSPQDIQASDGPASPPPPLDLDEQDCPGSPVSEAGDTAQEEEDKPEVTSEVTPAAPPDCSDEEVTSDAHINSEDQSEFLQSLSKQSVSTDVDNGGSDEREEEEKVVQEEEKRKEQDEDSFPPPPSPVFFNEDTEVFEDENEDATPSSPPSSQPQSPTSNRQTSAFSEDHQNQPTAATPVQSAAAPKPQDRMAAAPSRFAQAVAMAVQRSRLQRSGKSLGPQAPSGPHSTLPSPPRSIYQYGA